MTEFIGEWKPDTHRGVLIGICDRVDGAGLLRAWVFTSRGEETEYHWAVYDKDEKAIAGTDIFNSSAEIAKARPCSHVEDAKAMADRALLHSIGKPTNTDLRADLLATLMHACATLNIAEAYAALGVLADWREQEVFVRDDWSLRVDLSPEGTKVRVYFNGLQLSTTKE